MIATGVVTGIIVKDGHSVSGLTTAATLWATAAIGLATGYRMYTLAILVSASVFALRALHHVPNWERLGKPGDESHAVNDAADKATSSERGGL